jgi:rhodanese-related sulfurtransferase
MNTWLTALLSLLALATLLTAAYIWTIRPPVPYTEVEARSGLHYNTIDHVIDVRCQEEWAAGHYSAAYHLPLKQLPVALPSTLADRSKSLLFYGDGSKRATRIAQDLGYTRVGYLVQGSYKGLEHRDPPTRHEM